MELKDFIELAAINTIIIAWVSSFFNKGVVYHASVRVARVPVAVVKTLAGRA